MGWIGRLFGRKADQADTVSDEAPTSAAVDAYFDAKAHFEEERSARRLPQAMRCAHRALAQLGRYAAWFVADGGKPDELNGPADFLRDACILFAVSGDDAALAEAARVLEPIPKAEPWRQLVVHCRRQSALCGRVLATVPEHPGVQQSKLGALLGVNPEDVREVCYWLAEMRRVERRKQGRSYSLFPVRTDGA